MLRDKNVRCKRSLGVLLLILVQSAFGLDTASLTNAMSNSRSKRDFLGPKKYLIFPQGSNVQLVYCLTLGTYSKPGGIFTIGVTAGLAWELPHRNTVLYRKSAEVFHRRSRRDLYRKVEIMLRTQGRDGKACVLKALCEAGKRNSSEIRRGSFMEEILYAVFTLPGGSYEDDPETEYERTYASQDDCDFLYPTCVGSILKGSFF